MRHQSCAGQRRSRSRPRRLDGAVGVDDDLARRRVAARAVAARVGGQADAVEHAGPNLLRLRRVPVLLPADAVGGLLDAVANARIAERLLGVRVAVLVEVLQAELDRVHADRVRRLLHRHLQRERAVGMADAAIRALLVGVGEDVDRFELQVRDLVQSCMLNHEPLAAELRAARRRWR